jgi:hypothetical protein
VRICRKCSKQARDDSKICRDCGAILEDVPEEAVPVASPPPESPPTDGPPSSVEAQAAESGSGGGELPGEVVPWDHEPPPADEGRKPAWKCPGCGESVPGNFDVCWKCLTTKEGDRGDQTQAEFLQKIAAAEEPDQEAEPAQVYAEALGTEDEAEERPQLIECPRCGSSKLMRGVTVSDQGEYSDGRLKVVVYGDPAALIFKDRLYGEVKADICGRCGHVELRVVNPSELYRHYRKSVE